MRWGVEDEGAEDEGGRLKGSGSLNLGGGNREGLGGGGKLVWVWLTLWWLVRLWRWLSP